MATRDEWEQAKQEAAQQAEQTDGFVAGVTARLISEAVALKGIGIVEYNPNEPAHQGLQRYKAAEITFETANKVWSRTMFLFSEEFRLFDESLAALGLHIADVDGIPLRLKNVEITRPDGSKSTYRDRNGNERVRTATIAVEVLEIDDGLPASEVAPHPAPRNTPQPLNQPPQTQAEHVAATILRKTYAQQPLGGTLTPEQLVAAAGKARNNPATAGISDTRWRELAAHVLWELGSGDIPF